MRKFASLFGFIGLAAFSLAAPSSAQDVVRVGTSSAGPGASGNPFAMSTSSEATSADLGEAVSLLD